MLYVIPIFSYLYPRRFIIPCFLLRMPAKGDPPKTTPGMKKYLFLFTVLLWSATALAQEIFIEAESFRYPGGWVVDPQFMDQMGSPYLMAHGAGKPVRDAQTTFEAPRSGTYTVWVRTYNWNAPWDRKAAPGLFSLNIGGRTVGDGKLGTIGHWGWQKAGTVELPAGETTLSLHDRTGFNGRCDAVYLTTDRRAVPPDGGEELTAFRRRLLGTQRPAGEERYEFIVVGGGVAGVSAAVAAARMGVKTLLIHNRPVLGGNNSPEINIIISGKVRLGGYPNIGVVVTEMGNVYRDPQQVQKVVEAEPDLTVKYGMHASEVEMEGDRIAAVIATDLKTGERYRYQAPLFADCTGDGNLGYMAGADYTMRRETRKEFNEGLAPEVESQLSYGSTLKWRAARSDAPVTFPECPWAVQFTEATCQRVMNFQWFWETGFHRDQIAEAEMIRDYWFRVIYGNWAFLKNHAEAKAEYADADLNNVSFILGKRESRRLLGDYIFTQNDVEGGWKNLPDTAVTCTYSLDQHFPHPENSVWFPGEEFLATMKHNYNPMGISRGVLPKEKMNGPYMLPLRSLYSRNVDNLFMAGRHVSGTRIAMTSFRVMGSTGMMGEVVGITASLCKKYGCMPRGIYTDHLAAFREALGRGIDRKFPAIYNPDNHM